MSGLQQLVERIERERLHSDRIELSLAEIETLVEHARLESLQQIKNEIPRVKVHARKRGYNAAQAIGYLDQLLSWHLTDQ